MLESSTTLTAIGTKPGRGFGSWLLEWLRRCATRPARQLRLSETLALGERRFVAVVEFGPQRFLIGATGSSMVLLARLPAADSQEPSGLGGEI